MNDPGYLRELIAACDQQLAVFDDRPDLDGPSVDLIREKRRELEQRLHSFERPACAASGGNAESVRPR